MGNPSQSYVGLRHRPLRHVVLLASRHG